ncbi:leucine-rich repeat-containing protein [Asbolus verrucosus]|uniref:Leucine-rich repeat-containing protein n=1 Tax=Asbolus verrucosus TaxID=1661398 RepID=A0A482WCW2_ASBVE|nr:leucine-rich repeat-containing protein [Asbolus verrucosus]
MPQCAVVGCNSSHRKTKGGSIRYHRFPGDSVTRARWVQACGKYVQNCSTARICSRHFTDDSYERDVQHELLGLPTRCRLKKGAAPDRNLPTDFLKEETLPESAIAILLAVGLVPAKLPRKSSGGLPQDLTKMQIMEDVREGCSVQPSSPGHAEERVNNEEANKASTDPEENGFEEESSVSGNNPEESPKKDTENEEPKEDKPNEPENGEADKTDNNLEANNVNEESCSNTSSEETPNNKRKSENQDSSNKRLRMEIEENFISRDKILNDFIENSDCNNVEQLQIQTEQILAEIRTLNELAREKEREWNNIIHLKKMKEELLLRMQRRKQVMLLNSDKNENGEILFSESQTDSVGLKNVSNQSILKANLTNPNKSLRIPNVNSGFDKNKHRNILPKPQQYSQEMNGSIDYRQNKQRPVLDVQSIIADYRQRHPETVPRRGRRIRNSHNDSKNPNNHVLNFSSLALGSGAQVHHNIQGLDVNSELGILLNAMDTSRTDCSRPSSAESSTAQTAEPSFKDMLVQFAKLSQSERHELIQNAIKPPPPYPEVTVHPVPTTNTVAPTNSLLHGILTKSPSKTNTKTSFSPTLARLLTAPERGNSHSPNTATISNNLNNPANMSISEILSTSKARNEITITPVGAQYESPLKGKSAAQEEDEAEDSADRLVIDESSEVLDGRGRGDNSSDAGDEVPQCQGCNQKSALFVCAGCGNQWYCSRDCQVSAWDEHSEVCSG